MAPPVQFRAAVQAAVESFFADVFENRDGLTAESKICIDISALYAD